MSTLGAWPEARATLRGVGGRWPWPGACVCPARGDLRVSDRQDCVEQLLRNMFDGEQTESCLVSGTQVLLTLLEARRAG